MAGYGNWQSRFRGQGCRWTVPRQAVLSCLTQSNRHMSPKDIFAEIGRKFPGIGLTSVYRTLELLDRMGLLHKIRIGDGQIRYGLKQQDRDDHHHHLICTRCGKIIDYTDFVDEELELIKKTEASLASRHGFKIQDHKIEFYGICGSCRDKDDKVKK
jgi:Fur family transcriptional regulator, ferric uptake regulator